APPNVAARSAARRRPRDRDRRARARRPARRHRRRAYAIVAAAPTLPLSFFLSQRWTAARIVLNNARVPPESQHAPTDDLSARIAELEAALATERARANALVAERDRLRAAYRQLQIDLDLLRRRIFVAKAERVETRQLKLEFATKKTELDKL